MSSSHTLEQKPERLFYMLKLTVRQKTLIQTAVSRLISSTLSDNDPVPNTEFTEFRNAIRDMREYQVEPVINDLTDLKGA